MGDIIEKVLSLVLNMAMTLWTIDADSRENCSVLIVTTPDVVVVLSLESQVVGLALAALSPDSGIALGAGDTGAFWGVDLGGITFSSK